MIEREKYNTRGGKINGPVCVCVCVCPCVCLNSNKTTVCNAADNRRKTVCVFVGLRIKMLL